MRNLIVIFALAAMCSTAAGVRVTVNSIDTPSQDPLILHTECHELGTGAFPTNELISAVDMTTQYTPCTQNPDTQLPNFEVTIVNLTTTTWSELVYVADPETTLTNDDGTVNGELAFNIDNLGPLNFPLIYEDNPNLLFEPGETWKFVIQDYVNSLGLPASTLSSVGLVGNQSVADTLSSGSIIAIPEPASLTLLLLGGLAVMRRRRR